MFFSHSWKTVGWFFSLKAEGILSSVWNSYSKRGLYHTHHKNNLMFSRVSGESNSGYLGWRTKFRRYTEIGGDPMGKVHTISVHELAPDGKWQVGKAEENCIDRLRRGRPWAEAISHVAESPGESSVSSSFHFTCVLIGAFLGHPGWQPSIGSQHESRCWWVEFRKAQVINTFNVGKARG